jgi:alpha-1,6-mannosyltransferase
MLSKLEGLNWLRRRPLAAFVALGLLSEIIYLIYVLLFPLTVYGYHSRPYDMEQIARDRHWMGAAWVGGLALLFALYAIALFLSREKRVPLRLVVVFSLVFGVTLIWLYPVTATDLFQYVMRARVQVVYDANPLAAPPARFPDDPLLPFVGEWKDGPSPYGPAWELLAGAVASLGFTGAVSGALAYKVVALLAYLVCMAALFRGTGADSRALLFFAWNPLVLLQGLGNGHNDMVMLAWLLLALIAWERFGNWLAATVALSVAVLVKASAGVMAPLLLVAVLRAQPNWRQRALAFVGMAALGAGVTLLTYLPFWPPWESIAGVVDEMSQRYTYTIAATLRMILREMIPPQAAWDAPRMAGQFLFLGIFGWLLGRVWHRRLDLAPAGFLAFFTYLVSGPSYRIWYPIWLVPLAALALTRATLLRTFLFCFTSEFSIVVFYYIWRWYWPAASWLQIHLLTAPWQFGLPLILPILLEQTAGTASIEERMEPGAYHAAGPEIGT